MEFKWLTVPFSNQTKEVKVPQMWEVRWKSRFGEFCYDVRPELECFLSQEEAEEFADSLRKAFRLIRHSSATSVTVKKNDLKK